MRKLLLALAFLWGGVAHAQQVDWPPPAGTIASLCVYNLVQPVITSGKAAYTQCDANGNLRITGTLTVSNPSVGTNGATAPTSSTLGGCRNQNAEATADTNGQMGPVACDLVNKQIVLPFANPENYINPVPTAAITDTTSTQVMASISSFRNYVTYCKVTNSHATVGTFVQILDGATVIDSGYAAPAGGGWVTRYTPPLRGTATTAVNCQATTTGANFKCSCGGFKGT